MRIARTLLGACAVILCLKVAEAADAAADGVVVRIFLKDGTAVASYGEFARVDDRVVFSLPLDYSGGMPRLQLVTIPAESVDWTRTDQYMEAARRARYLASRAEDDFQHLNAEIASGLVRLAAEQNQTSRLTIATQMRRLLGEWPLAHFNYRQHDVLEITRLVDETISDLRAATGARDFDLSFVANVEAPRSVALLPDPSPGEIIDQAAKVARLADSHTERVSLWRIVLDLLSRASELPAAWVRGRHDDAKAALSLELETERAYRRLFDDLLLSASTRAARADVRGIEGLVARADRANAELGNRRPQEMADIHARLRDYLERARVLRLARDQWETRVGEYRAYARSVSPSLRDLRKGRGVLDDIHHQAGPGRSALDRFSERLRSRRQQLGRIAVPRELESAHAVLANACQLALTAAIGRRSAIEAADATLARNAAAAAAGAIMLTARAQWELNQHLQKPQLR